MLQCTGDFKVSDNKETEIPLSVMEKENYTDQDFFLTEESPTIEVTTEVGFQHVDEGNNTSHSSDLIHEAWEKSGNVTTDKKTSEKEPEQDSLLQAGQPAVVEPVSVIPLYELENDEYELLALNKADITIYYCQFLNKETNEIVTKVHGPQIWATEGMHTNVSYELKPELWTTLPITKCTDRDGLAIAEKFVNTQAAENLFTTEITVPLSPYQTPKNQSLQRYFTLKKLPWVFTPVGKRNVFENQSLAKKIRQTMNEFQGGVDINGNNSCLKEQLQIATSYPNLLPPNKKRRTDATTRASAIMAFDGTGVIYHGAGFCIKNDTTLVKMFEVFQYTDPKTKQQKTEEFFPVPGYEGYAISPSGFTVNLKTSICNRRCTQSATKTSTVFPNQQNPLEHLSWDFHVKCITQNKISLFTSYDKSLSYRACKQTFYMVWDTFVEIRNRNSVLLLRNQNTEGYHGLTGLVQRKMKTVGGNTTVKNGTSNKSKPIDYLLSTWEIPDLTRLQTKGYTKLPLAQFSQLIPSIHLVPCPPFRQQESVQERVETSQKSQRPEQSGGKKRKFHIPRKYVASPAGWE